MYMKRACSYMDIEQRQLISVMGVYDLCLVGVSLHVFMLSAREVWLSQIRDTSRFAQIMNTWYEFNYHMNICKAKWAETSDVPHAVVIIIMCTHPSTIHLHTHTHTHTLTNAVSLLASGALFRYKQEGL